MMIRQFLTITFATLSLTACSSWMGAKEDAPLEGKRVSVLELQKTLETSDVAADAQGFISPPAWDNEFWPQASGYPTHNMQHVALDEGLDIVWTADIGTGGDDDLPLVSTPIVVDGKVFTMDADLDITAFDEKDGDKIWRVSLLKKSEDDDTPIGGGLAFSGARLFVTTGFDILYALDPKDGKVIWQTPLSGPARSAPTALAGRVFVQTMDNRLVAVAQDTGRVLWEHEGGQEAASLLGGASPAADKTIVVPAFSSGEIFALQVANGAVAWADNLSAVRRVDSLSGLSDIRGLPVMDRGVVFAISFGGRMVAIDQRTGRRIWQREIGGQETPWVVGNRVFLLNTDNQLVSLARESGAIQWVKTLPGFENESDHVDPIVWSGPVFAGGKVAVVGSNDEMRLFDPVSGEQTALIDIEERVYLPPVVANKTLYLLANDGTLMAWRGKASAIATQVQKKDAP